MNPLEHDDEFQLSIRNPNPSFRALKSGDVYRVDFELSKEEWEYFTDPNIDRAGMVLENICRVTHRAPKPSVGDISQVPATTLASTDQSEPVKGGKWSKQAGMQCNNTKFHAFLITNYPRYWDYHQHAHPDEELLYEEEISNFVMRELLNIKSRKEIDTNPEARKRFMDLMGEFNRWTEGKYGPD